MNKMILALIGFLMTSSQVLAQEVAITKRGLIYHDQNCEQIKRESASIVSLEEAQEKGMRPCSLCQQAGKFSNKRVSANSRELKYLRNKNEFKVQ